MAGGRVAMDRASKRLQRQCAWVCVGPTLGRGGCGGAYRLHHKGDHGGGARLKQMRGACHVEHCDAAVWGQRAACVVEAAHGMRRGGSARGMRACVRAC
eukprot:7066034-Prymnesium_polylepis.1